MGAPLVNSATPEQKQAALDLALHSKTLARAEQLRHLLSYLCAAEGEGRTVTEYSIGHEALGRPADFSPLEDSSVRTRIYELRHKLERLYQLESPSAPVRIVLPKGTYLPQFEVAHRDGATAADPAPIPPQPARRVSPLVWTTAGLLLGAAAGFLWTRSAPLPVSSPDPILAEAWGPLARPTANVLMAVATPLHMTVGPESHRAFASPTYPAPEEAYPLWRQHRPLAPGAKLGMVFSDNLIGFGTMSAVLRAATTIESFGGRYQILPERVAPLAAQRDRNVILFGAPVDSDSVSFYHQDTPLLVDYDSGVREFVILDRERGVILAPEKDEGGQFRVVYGLITVLHGRESAGNRLGLVGFSGITSTGTHGAAEYFASAKSLRELKARFGPSGFPQAFQAVIRCTFSNKLLGSYECIDHRDLTDPSLTGK